MTIKQFVDKAIKGGWDESQYQDYSPAKGYESAILLDPEAWKAVGKVEGWEDSDSVMRDGWKFKMHDMIDALAEGKSVEDFITTL